MSCSKISECLVAFVPLNYQSPANFVSAGDYYFLLGKVQIMHTSRPRQNIPRKCMIWNVSHKKIIISRTIKISRTLVVYWQKSDQTLRNFAA